MVGRIPGGHVGEAGLDAAPDERELPSLLPLGSNGELVVAEHLSDALVRLLGVGLGKRHRHVDVGRARVEGALEDARHEPGVGGVQDRIAPMGAGHSGDVGGVGRVDARGTELPVGAEAVDDTLRARLVDVGEHDAFVEVAPGRDRRERRAHAPGAHHQDLHGAGVYPTPAVRHESWARGSTPAACTEIPLDISPDYPLVRMGASWSVPVDFVVPVRLMGDRSEKEEAMKYMLLIQQGDTPTPQSPEAWATLSEDEQKAVFADYQAINQTPGVTPGLGLDVPETATTVRVKDGKTLTTDGPFVEIKEAIGGYLFYEAEDLDAAIELASRIPAARLGGAIEVRPIKEW